MGMFDNIRCYYKLPVRSVQYHEFQTKDTPRQFCDNYEIHVDGTLWQEDYTIKPTEGTGWKQINKHWVFCDFTGEIRFYDIVSKRINPGGWIEFSAYFKNGKLRELNQIKGRFDDFPYSK